MMSDLKTVLEQERRLVLPKFDEDIAFELGTIGWRIATERQMPIAIDIRTFDRQIVYLSRPGASSNNSEWVRRKANTVRRFLKSTYRIVLEQGREGEFSPKTGADIADYVMAGGGFPIVVQNAGIIGSLTISGLTGEEDHAFAAQILMEHLKIDPA